MEEEKLKVPVYEGMARILEVVNGNYVAKVMGVSANWVSCKQQCKANNRGYRVQYLPTDMAIINSALPKLANDILKTCLIPKEIHNDSDAVSLFLRNEARPILKLKNIAQNRMGHDYAWLRSRLEVVKNSSRRSCKFTPKDAADFNRAFQEIILYIRGVEMEYEPPKE